MKNQEQEVILEEVVETEEKTKKSMPVWLKNTLLVIGGAALTTGAFLLAGGKSEDQGDVDYLESSNDSEPTLIEGSVEDSYENRNEE